MDATQIDNFFRLSPRYVAHAGGNEPVKPLATQLDTDVQPVNNPFHGVPVSDTEKFRYSIYSI